MFYMKFITVAKTSTILQKDIVPTVRAYLKALNSNDLKNEYMAIVMDLKFKNQFVVFSEIATARYPVATMDMQIPS